MVYLVNAFVIILIIGAIVGPIVIVRALLAKREARADKEHDYTPLSIKGQGIYREYLIPYPDGTTKWIDHQTYMTEPYGVCCSLENRVNYHYGFKK